MYTLQKGNKTLSLIHKGHHYVIGFKNIKQARNVQYNIHPDPQFHLHRGVQIDLGKQLQHEGLTPESLILDTSATLRIPKYLGSPSDPMNDGYPHLNTVVTHDFMTYPLTKMLGIIIPFEILEENKQEFIFRSHVIEPSFNPGTYKPLSQ